MRTLVLVVLGLVACATSSQQPMGIPSDLSVSSAKFCQHKVPNDVCTRCNPQLVPKFKAVKDWCPEHDVPESQCYACHPDLSFAALPELPPGADLKRISQAGEDVALEAHLVPGKVTLVDFYADWCAPCRKIDVHVFGLLQKRTDLAVRKVNVGSWDTPIAKHYLANVQNLPHVVVYDKNGKQVAALTGVDLAALDQAIAKASAP